MNNHTNLTKEELCSTIEITIKNILADKAFQYKKIARNILFFSIFYIIIFFSMSYAKIKNAGLILLMAGNFFSVFFIAMFPNVIDVNDYINRVKDSDIIETDTPSLFFPPLVLFTVCCITYEASKYLYINNASELTFISAIFVFPYFLLFHELLLNEKEAEVCVKKAELFQFKEKEYEKLVQYGYFMYEPANFVIKLGDAEMLNMIMACNKIRKEKIEKESNAEKEDNV